MELKTLGKTKLALVLTALFFTLFVTWFYRGIYFPPFTALHDVSVSVVEAPQTPFAEMPAKAKGLILFDFFHNNSFSRPEVKALESRIIARGFAAEYAEEKTSLLRGLKAAAALVVIGPKEKYSQEEVAAVKEFLGKGGRLLLLADPDRESEVNFLSSQLGVVFERNYLYNMRFNDGNFKYVFFKRFSYNNLTKGLDKIVFYSACSLLPKSGGIVFGDEWTYSSLKESREGFSPVLLFNNSVLAVCDQTFLTEPYNLVEGNDRFISNVVDWLVGAPRTFVLMDFPAFLREKVVVVAVEKELAKQALELKNTLASPGRSVELTGSVGEGVDAVLLGLFSSNVSNYLSSSGASVGDVIEVDGLEFDKKDASLLYLRKEKACVTAVNASAVNASEANASVPNAGVVNAIVVNTSEACAGAAEGSVVLVVLSYDAGAASRAIVLLESGELRKYLVKDDLAVVLPETPKVS